MRHDFARTLNFAHRGARRAAPENTLAAFAKALELGADGIELDTSFSKDGVLVVCHNPEVDETSNGSGRIHDFPLSALRELDFGGWFDPAFAGEKIPTLDEVFDLVGSRLLVNIEMKTVSLRSDGLEAAVAALIARRNLYDQVIVSSFNPFALRRLRRLDPRIETGLLYSTDLPIYLRRAWLLPWVKPRALHPEHVMVDAGTMAWAQRGGYDVNVWTVNEEADMQRLLDLGVNSIITDVPDRLRRLIQAGSYTLDSR